MAEKQWIEKIVNRALYYSTQMIYLANHRKDKVKGDPKIGGHSSACASYLHIAAALHLKVRKGHDCIAVKPHAAPMDHTFHYLLNLFLEKDFTRFDLEKSKVAMHGLRKYSAQGEPVFQSYHSAYDCDHFNYLPSGTVGIPPVQLGYLAHAYRLAEDNNFEVPKDAHFWAVMGDSEYREGSLQEALPDFAERELGNLTWIVDYNRQSLDGNRITNNDIMNGTDNERIERTALASGWHVIQIRHGKFRKKLFQKEGGKDFQEFLENDLEDFALQSLLITKDMSAAREKLLNQKEKLKTFLKNVSDEELYQGLHDLGGHDIEALTEAMLESKKDPRRPTLIIAHTIKGWGLPIAAAAGNHNSLPGKEEVEELQKKEGIPDDDLFAFFDKKSEEAKFLKKRGDELYKQILKQEELRQRNVDYFTKALEEEGLPDDEIGINLKLVSYPHTQWMLGQLSAKLNRIANTPLDSSQLAEKQKPLSDSERRWKIPAEMMVSMAPDVGTSTNLNPTMDGQVYDPETEDYEEILSVKDKSVPDLVPSEEKAHKFIRFEIEESNTMSCVGSYGRIRDMLGIPLMPLMTIYDFFVKRALDQHFYNLYWKSSFIMMGTPAGVTLSPEGAQHGWKSDFQIPNQITWEPFYCQELDFILADAIKRHITYDNEGRSGVHIRCVTRGAEQKDLINFLRSQSRFKEDSSVSLHHKDYPISGATNEKDVAAISDQEILSVFRQEVLSGAYYLIDYRGYAGYIPGDNVVNIFSMGSPTTEAIKASQQLLSRGIYANVIVVTSSDLIAGNLAHESDYDYLKNYLSINADLYVGSDRLDNSGEYQSLAGRRIPMVSVHDGEPGLLDNLGSIVGVRHECLATRKHSKCGRPEEIYAFHGINHEAIVNACGKVLSETALEQVKVRKDLVGQTAHLSSGHWKELWPEVSKN